jgi:hypothetical protein
VSTEDEVTVTITADVSAAREALASAAEQARLMTNRQRVRALRRAAASASAAASLLRQVAKTLATVDTEGDRLGAEEITETCAGLPRAIKAAEQGQDILDACADDLEMLRR